MILPFDVLVASSLSRILTPFSSRLKCSRDGSSSIGIVVLKPSSRILKASFTNSALLLYPLFFCLMIASISSIISFGSLTTVYSPRVMIHP